MKTEVGEIHLEQSNVNLEPSTDEVSSPQRSTSPTHDELTQLFKHLEEINSSEEKVACALEHMGGFLSHQPPKFRNFWEMRKKLISLLKDEQLAPDMRLSLWNRVVELSKEANRLKAGFNEQSAFIAEQIDLAIQSLDNEISSMTCESKDSNKDFFSEKSSVLAHRLELYQTIQSNLQLFNAYAARIHSLRKEVMNGDMLRISARSRLFQKISSTGELIFPRRKELIQEVSQYFLADVQKFISDYFKDTYFRKPLFFLRDEIKALQGMAKVLTLNTSTFSQTRLLLSECWDKIKVAEKERKKIHSEQKSLWKVHAEKCNEKIAILEETFNNLSLDLAKENLREFQNFVRSQPLSHEMVKKFRDKIESFRQIIKGREKSEQEERALKVHLAEQQKLEKYTEFKDQVLQLLENATHTDLDFLTSQREMFISQIPTLPFSKQQKREIENLLKNLKDTIDDKKEQMLLALPADERGSIEKIQQVLSDKKAKRKEMEEQLKSYKTASAASGLNIEQAMKYNELIHCERENLQKVDQSIQELEHKLADILG